MNNNKKWNWEQKDWPNFSYDEQKLKSLETQFIYDSGILLGAYKHIGDDERTSLTIEIMSDEALKTSEIEGEILNRESIQSSIRRNFGLSTINRKANPAENGIAEMMVDLYNNFNKHLTHKMLFNWHSMLMNGRRDIKDIGRYRTGDEPMLVVSGSVDSPKIHFQAPESKRLKTEMKNFIEWFNKTAPGGPEPLSTLTRASIAHLFFVSIHPFEDGNGRIARALSIKAISQSINSPMLIALSQTIQNNKKEYYSVLQKSNRNNKIDDWNNYFAQTIITAQRYSLTLIDFLIQKAKFYDVHKNNMNERQLKVVSRIFKEGISGFKGGLSAEKYISITSTSRATATRDLSDLVSKKILTQTGFLKSTRYYLNLKDTRFSVIG